MTEDRKMIKAIAKLNWLTQDKLIVWEKVESPDFKVDFESGPQEYTVYGTKYEGKNIGLIVSVYYPSSGDSPIVEYRLGVFNDGRIINTNY
jgi:hypothetical protein